MKYYTESVKKEYNKSTTLRKSAFYLGCITNYGVIVNILHDLSLTDGGRVAHKITYIVQNENNAFCSVAERALQSLEN